MTIKSKRQVFYSFHYKPDNWRVATVRSIGAIEGNKPATDNDWETVTCQGDEAIKNWIKSQMKYRSCTLVLVGSETANRKWINHEIIESWNSGMGVAGIYIHGLLNKDGSTTNKGLNPFDYILLGNGSVKLSTIVNCYEPTGLTSREKYAWIRYYIEDIVEEAINIRKRRK